MIVTLSAKTLSRSACVALIGALLGTPASARERTPVVESVELQIPMAPAVFTVEGKKHLAYEVHITNFLAVDVALTRVWVTGGDAAAQATLADHRDAELVSRIGRPGLRRSHPDPHVIGPGMRAVGYLWFPLPEGFATLPALRHRVELDILRPTGPVHAVVEGAPVRIHLEPPVVLDPPLRDGPWVAIYAPQLKGGHRTAIYTLEGRARIPARFAVDWIRLPPGGALERTHAAPPSDWNGFGTEVLAVADGVVAAALDDIPDNMPARESAPEPHKPENASGNYVALDLGRGRFAFYEHLKRGSVAVKAGDRVKSGQVIGRLGNSGSSSMGPHLHFHVSDAGSPLAAEGLPFVFRQFDHLGAFASIEALIAGEQWAVSPEGQAAARRLEMPSANSVVRFR